MSGLVTQMNRLNLNSSSSKVHRLPQYQGCRATQCVAARVTQRSKAAMGRVPLHIQCARIVNVEIPNNKRIVASLTYIYGIGASSAKKILESTGVENKRTYDLESEELQKLADEIEKYQIEGDLRRQVAMDIKRLKDIGCYRGRRHIMNLPVRGQKTKTNARTRKGKRGSPIKGKK